MLVGMQNAAARTSMEVAKKVKNRITYDPGIPFLGLHPKELKSGSPRNIIAPMLTAALFTTAKIQRHSVCCMHTVGCSSELKKKEIFQYVKT